MLKTLHISLKQTGSDTARLRYYFDNPNDFKAHDLELASIEKLMDDAEARYYTILPADLIETGRQLYAWLDSADRFLARAIENTRGTEGLVLAISTEGNLDHLPWEVLHDGTAFLVQRTNPFVVPVRWKDQPSTTEKPANRALRVLFMATSPLDVQPKLNFEAEEGMILDATKKQPLALIVEESGDLEELENLVDSYGEGHFDVFHLTGHADLRDDGPRFLTETATGEVHYATAEEIAGALKRMPDLLFLSGCRTGEAGKAGTVPSLAEALLGLGAKAVLGWGRPVLDTDANEAAAALYEALSKGFEPARAVSLTYRALLKQKARHWHLLRLYVAGEAPGALVTPLRTKGREKAPPTTVTTRFLDKQGLVKVPTREGFVGRRRPLQRCLRAIRYDTDKVGVLLHGMGGLGKSSLAARLSDRLTEYEPLVWVGPLDEPALVNRLADEMTEQALRERVLDPRTDLDLRLRNLFDRVEQSFLLVLDDFEANMERRDGQLVLRDGAPVLSVEAKEVLEALTNALRKTEGQHRLLITCRYTLNTREAAYLYHEQLAPFRDADLKKKIDRLDKEQKALEASQEAKTQAIDVADGNPRLLEWLYDVLAQKDLDHDVILARMAEKEAEFREDILAEELLKQQEPDLRKALALALTYDIPAPWEAVTAVCEDIPDLERHRDRAAALGLLEVMLLPSEVLYRVPRILTPLLASERPDDEAALSHQAAETLYRIWWEASEERTEERSLEIHRLALAGHVTDMAVEIAVAVTKSWYNRCRYRDVVDLCERTLPIVQNDYRVLHQLARAEVTLGHVEQALKHFQQALETCPDEDAQEKATILNNLADLYTRQGRIEQALDLYQQSLALKESFGNVQGKAATLGNMAKIYNAQGQIEKALELYQKVLAITEQKNPQYTATTLHNMAVIYAQQGQIKQALDLYQQSMYIKESIDDVRGKAATLHQMAIIYAQQGQIKQALDLYQQSIDIEESIGNVQGKAATLAMMAQLLADEQGDFDTALAYLKESIAILAHLQSPDVETVKRIASQAEHAPDAGG